MATPAVQQLNVRLDANVKRNADEVLSFVGSSATEVIRALFSKIAGGAADYVEIMAVLCPKDKKDVAGESIVSEGWSIADDFYRSIGYDPSVTPAEERSWNEVYTDAMDEHFREKGIRQ